MTILDGLKADFDVLDDWEDRYRHVIELGRELTPLDEKTRIPANKVRGCASQVWIHTISSGSPPVLTFHADSDALIVKGLIAILLGLFSGKSADGILKIDAKSNLSALGLESNLSQQRTNGLHSMIERINADARSLSARS